MARKILTAGFCGLLAAPAAAAASPPLVVEGNHRLSADDIGAFFPAETDGNLSNPDLDAALKAMYRTEQFSSVDIKRDGSAIHVKVVENPQISRLAFEGNRKLKDEQLKTIVQSKAGGPLSRPFLRDDIERLLDAYRRAGKLGVEITPKLITRSEGSADLVFEINEGDRIGVRSVGFAGNKAFSVTELKDAISTGETNLLSFMLENDLYDPDKVDADREKLSRFYRARGYADVEIVTARPAFDAASKILSLTYTIDEGGKFRIGDVTIDSSLQGIDVARLRPLLLSKSGDIYNADAIDKTVQALTKELSAQQRPFVAVRPDLRRRADGQTVDLVFQLENGRPLYVERIEVHGNVRTRDNVIRREIDLVEGAAYDRAMLHRAELRLNRLGFFKSVKISKQPGSVTDRVIVDVTVEEQNSGNFFVSGGHSDSDGWLGEVSLQDGNLLGGGQQGKVALSYGQYAKGFNVAFTEPYLFGRRISLGVDLAAKSTISSNFQSFGSSVYGATMTLGTPLTDALTPFWRYSIQNQTVTLDPARGGASLPVQDAAAKGPQWVSLVGSGITYDTVDSKQNPHNGLRVTVNNDVAGLGGDVRFMRNTNDLRYYRELGWGIVGLARMQSGMITPYSGQTLPLLDGFFGGPQLVRGFAPSGFGPRDLTPGTARDNIGGNAFWASSYELQAPFPGLPQSFGLKVALFADAGSLWSRSGSKLAPALSSSLVGNSSKVRSSIGTGLVWNSILGPIRMDYAYPLSKANYDVTQRLRFGYGMF